MLLQQTKNLKKPPPDPAARKHSACIDAAKKQTTVSTPPAAAAASTKRSACASLKDNNSISSKDESQAQLSNNKPSNYTNNNPPPAAAKRPALDSNKIAVVTPAKAIKSTKVFAKDLRYIACSNNSRLNNLLLSIQLDDLINCVKTKIFLKEFSRLVSSLCNLGLDC